MRRREWLALTGCAALAGCGKREILRVYRPDMEDHGNPERGFYVQREAEDPGDLSGLRGRGISLVLLTLDLKHYRNRPLDDAKLSVLDEAMRRFRGTGLKVIFRAAYGFTDADYRVDPKDLALIRAHITAISKALAPHAPWVFAVQAGMLGPWGEWHGSNHGDPPSLEARQAVFQTWSERLPSSIFLQVRRPMFLRDMKADLDRAGCHNDALLAMPDDMGTYAEPGWDRARELAWAAEKLKSVPFGGETVPDSESTPPGQVLDELGKLHATYLNSGYHEGTLAKWKQSLTESGNLLDVVKRRLGYRLDPVRMKLDGSKGSLVLSNSGFAAPQRPRRVSFAWFDPAAKQVAGEPLTETRDLRAWLPDAGEIELPFNLPPKPAGRTLVPAVRLADDSDELAEDGRHAIRLAGLRFEEASGWNLLG